MLLPEGAANFFAMKAGDIMKYKTEIDNKQLTYRVELRGLVTKMPGFQFFTGLNISLLNMQGIIASAQYQEMMQDLFEYNADYEDNYLKAIDGYEFADDVPKESLFVKLNPDITDDQRVYVANGIRNYFIGQTNVIFVKHDTIQSFAAVQKIFSLFTAIIAAISLFLAFFLLLISMTQNVNDASWEFGVLRSMGLTKSEGMRIYMYEAYAVVVSAAILGVIVGFVTASAVAVQFYAFIELPVTLTFPWVLFGIMISLSLITVFFAVYAPVNSINNRQVSSVLRGGN